MFRPYECSACWILLSWKIELETSTTRADPGLQTKATVCMSARLALDNTNRDAITNAKLENAMIEAILLSVIVQETERSK